MSAFLIITNNECTFLHLKSGVKEESHGHQDNQHQWPNKPLEVLHMTENIITSISMSKSTGVLIIFYNLTWKEITQRCTVGKLSSCILHLASFYSM